MESESLTKAVKEIRRGLDEHQLNLYNYFRPDIRSLKGLSIIDDSNQTIVKVGMCIFNLNVMHAINKWSNFKNLFYI